MDVDFKTGNVGGQKEWEVLHREWEGRWASGSHVPTLSWWRFCSRDVLICPTVYLSPTCFLGLLKGELGGKHLNSVEWLHFSKTEL